MATTPEGREGEERPFVYLDFHSYPGEIIIGGKEFEMDLDIATKKKLVERLKDAHAAAVKKAVDDAVEKERLLCADFVRHVHGEDTLASELEKRPETEAALRSAK